MRFLVILALILVVSQARLYTVEQIMEKLNKEGGLPNYQGVQSNLEIPETTCNTVDPTPILPEGQDASDFITRSGYLKMGKGNSAFGFIFWGSMAAKGDETKLKDYPTLIWLQGGPGGSSQFGDFTEMGPIIVTGRNGDFSYRYNPYSWNQEYNMIFIDNPIGTGLSNAEKFSDIPTNMDQVSEDLYNGLVSLYTDDNGCFNLLNLTESPLFVTGESYAGKYVPSIAGYIIKKVKEDDIVRKALMKGGIAVGDGFTDPKNIMLQLPQFGYNLSMLNQSERDVAQLNAQSGVEEMLLGNWIAGQQAFNQVMEALSSQSGLNNPYNWADTENGPDPLDLTEWLNQVSIKTDVFKFPEQLKYSDQSMPVYIALSTDFMQSYPVKTLQNQVLKKDFPVLYYNGQNDVIVCTPCTEVWLDKVKYSGQKEFAAATFTPWEAQTEAGPKISGYYKQADNLAFVTVNQAGHMVPSDQPEAAYTMITEFVNYVTQRNEATDKKAFDKEFGMFKLNRDKFTNKTEQVEILE